MQLEDDHDYQGCTEQRLESDEQQRGVVGPTLPDDPSSAENQAQNPQSLEPLPTPEDVNPGPGPTPAHPEDRVVDRPVIMCTRCLLVGDHIQEDCLQDQQSNPSNPPLVQLYEAESPELRVELLHVLQGTIPCRVCGSDSTPHEHQLCFRQATFYFQDGCLQVEPFKLCRSVMDSISATGRDNVRPLQNVLFVEITIDTMKTSVFESGMPRWIPTINSPRTQVMDIHPYLFPPRMEIRHVQCARNAIRTMQMSVRGDEIRLQETGTVEVAVEEMGKNQTITITQLVVIVANGVGRSCRSVKPLPFATSVNSPILDLH